MRETQVLEVGNISRYLHVSYSTVSITSEQLKIFVRSNISDPRHVSISQFFETMFPNPFISLARYPRLPKIILTLFGCLEVQQRPACRSRGNKSGYWSSSSPGGEAGWFPPSQFNRLVQSIISAALPIGIRTLQGPSGGPFFVIFKTTQAYWAVVLPSLYSSDC